MCEGCCACVGKYSPIHSDVIKSYIFKGRPAALSVPVLEESLQTLKNASKSKHYRLLLIPLTAPLYRPFSCLVFFTFLVGLAPSVAIIVLTILHPPSSTCSHPVAIWMYATAGALFLNFPLSIYVFNRINRPYDPSNENESNFYARAKYIMCYDPLVALWMLLAMFSTAVRLPTSLIISNSLLVERNGSHLGLRVST